MTFKSKELQELVRFSREYANNGTLTNKLVVLLLKLSSTKTNLVIIVFSIKKYPILLTFNFLNFEAA